MKGLGILLFCECSCVSEHYTFHEVNLHTHTETNLFSPSCDILRNEVFHRIQLPIING